MTLCRSQFYEDRCHLLQDHDGRHRSNNGRQWEGEYRYAVAHYPTIHVPPQTLKRLEVRTEQATDYRAQRDALENENLRLKEAVRILKKALHDLKLTIEECYEAG